MTVITNQMFLVFNSLVELYKFTMLQMKDIKIPENLGEKEYLLNISASYGYFPNYIVVTIILEEKFPLFINCDSPLSILEYNLERLQGDTDYSLTSFTDSYDIKLKDSQQRVDGIGQNVRVDVISNPLFGSSSTWPQAISCTPCLYSDGSTQLGHATCCNKPCGSFAKSILPILCLKNSTMCCGC